MQQKIKFTITDIARADIEHTLTYIEEQLKNAKAARDLYGKIRDAFGRIALFPSAQPKSALVIPDSQYDLRKVPVGNYILYYGLSEDGVTILRFIYGGRSVDGKYF